MSLISAFISIHSSSWEHHIRDSAERTLYISIRSRQWEHHAVKCFIRRRMEFQYAPVRGSYESNKVSVMLDCISILSRSWEHQFKDHTGGSIRRVSIRSRSWEHLRDNSKLRIPVSIRSRSREHHEGGGTVA